MLVWVGLADIAWPPRPDATRHPGRQGAAGAVDIATIASCGMLVSIIKKLTSISVMSITYI